MEMWLPVEEWDKKDMQNKKNKWYHVHTNTRKFWRKLLCQRKGGKVGFMQRITGDENMEYTKNKVKK